MIETHIVRKVKGKFQFLLLKRSFNEAYGGIWQMVTGRVKTNESAVNAVIREIKEETSLIPKRIWVVPNVNSFYEFKYDAVCLIPVFLCLVNEKDDVILSEEHSEFKWVNKNEAIKLVTWPGQKKSINIIYDFLTKQHWYFHYVEVK